MKKHEFAKAIVFLILVALVFQLLTTIFVPKWYGTWQSTRIVDGFYEVPDQTLDVVLMGSSQTIMGLSPMELYESYGISSYSFGTEEQPIFATYYWLKEILRHHTPKVVVVDINEVLHSCNEAAYRKAFDYMKWSKVKWEAVTDHCSRNNLDLLGYLLPLTNYHSRWDELAREDFHYFVSEKTDPYFGFVISSGTCDIEYKGILPQEDAVADPYDMEAFEYLQKIIALCKENNMELLFVKTPRAGWSPQEHKLVAELAEESMIPFLDFNKQEIMQEMGFDYGLNARDGSHLNILGAEKIGSYLGAYLTENYTLTDHKADSAYMLWQESLPVYQMQKQDAKLADTSNFKEWLNVLSDEHTVLLAVSDGYLLQDLDDEIWLEISSLGFHTDALKSGADYAAIRENGAISTEYYGLGISDFHGILSDGSYYEISVTNPEKEDRGILSVVSILIDHQEYAVGGEGLHLVVYDPLDQEIVDTILVDTQSTDFPIVR